MIFFLDGLGILIVSTVSIMAFMVPKVRAAAA